MARTETVLQAFIGSPSDVSEERRIIEQVVRELNLTWRKTLGISIDLLKWETHATPGIGADPQDVINNSIGDDYDIFIGIMWSRFGTATSKHESGTEEEFRKAYSRWTRDNASTKIMFYFSNAGISPSNIDYEQIKKLTEFKKSLGKEGVLYWEYNGVDHFAQLARMHLSRVVQEWGTTIHHHEIQDSQMGDPSTRDLINSESLGFLDLVEELEEAIRELGEIGTRMNGAVTGLGQALETRGQEINASSANGSIPDTRVTKRIISKSSEDLQRFVNIMRPEIDNFSRCNNTVATASSKLVLLSDDFTGGQEQMVDLAQILDNWIEPLTTLPDTIRGFRNSITVFPRISVMHNQARKAAVETLDKFIDVIEESVSICREARELVRTAEA